MLIRPATTADIPGVASAAVAAYADDPQDAYLYPKRNDYPARYLKVKSDIIKHSLEDPTASPIVAVLQPSDEGWNGTPEITAFKPGFAKVRTVKMTSQGKIRYYRVSGAVRRTTKR